MTRVKLHVRISLPLSIALRLTAATCNLGISSAVEALLRTALDLPQLTQSQLLYETRLESPIQPDCDQT